MSNEQNKQYVDRPAGEYRISEPDAENPLVSDPDRVAAGPVLILVHGTGDTTSLDPAADEAIQIRIPGDATPLKPVTENITQRRWWQAGSHFDERLARRIAGPQGEDLTAECFARFAWSGLNSERAREEAAEELLKLVRKFDEAGRPIHILAHSHGGNVVRRTLELGSTGRNRVAERVRSVTSFGVPFFHYSITSRIGTAIAGLLIALTVAGLTRLGVTAARSTQNENWQTLWILLVLMFAGATLFFLGKAFAAIFRISIQRHRAALLIGKAVKWRNFCASKDEAISLLMSLNQPVQLMRRRNPTQVWMKGPLGCGYFVTVGALALGVGLGTWESLGFDWTFAKPMDATVTLIGVLICLVAAAVCSVMFGSLLFLILTVPVIGWNNALDLIITSRLRTLVYGADAGNGMSRVERFPWRGTEHCWVPIDAKLEASMEEYIATRTRDLWRNIRARLEPTIPLTSHDFRALVQEALTGDELAHTVYYHVEGFADLIADTLAATGDWTVRAHSRAE